MTNMSKEFSRNYVREQSFINSNNVLNILKELFKEVLQEALAAKMKEMLGYEKHIVNQSINQFTLTLIL